VVYPKCGKVLVIDDQITEARPLINLLSLKGIPTLYYSGKTEEFPESPFDDVRLVFCDLRLTTALDVKSVVSNIVAILRAVVSTENGPYILLVWSTCEDDYLEALNEALSEEKKRPVFVLPLAKADYFYSQNTIADVIEKAQEQIEELGLDVGDENRVKSIVDACFMPFSSLEQKPKEDALERMEKRLTEELEKANLMHLFVLWENTIGESAGKTINNIYQIIPDEIAPEEKLRAMLYYLAKSKLEQQTDGAGDEDKFRAAMSSLNEMFSHFCTDAVHKLPYSDFAGLKIEHIEGISEIKPAKLNSWIMTTTPSRIMRIGNVYEDSTKRFRYHGMIVGNKSKSESKYHTTAKELHEDKSIRYILLDISSECDIAQDKHFLTRVVPGVMIPNDRYLKLVEEKKLSGGKKDYIFKLNPIEILDSDWCIMFNLNQLCSVEHDEIGDDALLFAFASHYIASLKQDAARCISRQGIEMFAVSK